MSSVDPVIVLLFLLATVCASLAHVLWGRRWVQLPIFWLVALLACLLAYGLRLHIPLALPTPAGVPVLESVLLAWLLLIVASRLRI
jgi:hypothetical protein